VGEARLRDPHQWGADTLCPRNVVTCTAPGHLKTQTWHPKLQTPPLGV